MTPNTPKASPALSGEQQTQTTWADGVMALVQEFGDAMLLRGKLAVDQATTHEQYGKAFDASHRCKDAVRAALPPAQAEPLGQAGAWLPIEPTAEMLEAAAIYRQECVMTDRPLSTSKLYAAMLAAAIASTGSTT